MSKKIAVIGSGSWGVGLSILLNNNGYDPYIWSYDENEAKNINEKRECIFLIKCWLFCQNQERVYQNMHQTSTLL